MLFSEDETKVTLLDFQLMTILHPARDIWYFLAGTSDAEFRRLHLTSLVTGGSCNQHLEMTHLGVWATKRLLKKTKELFS